MRKLIGVALAAASLTVAGATATAARQVTPEYVSVPGSELKAGGTAYIDLDTGSVTFESQDASGSEADGTSSRGGPAYVGYDNVAPNGGLAQGFAQPASLNPVFGDQISLTAPGELTDSSFRFFQHNGLLLSGTFRLVMYDATGWSGIGYPAVQIYSLDFNYDFVPDYGPGGLPQSTFHRFDIFNFPPGIKLPQDVLITHELISHTGVLVNLGATVTPNQTPYVGTSDPTRAFYEDNATPPGELTWGGIVSNNLEFAVKVCPDIEVSPPTLTVSAALNQIVVLLDAIEISNVNGCEPLGYSITSNCGISGPPGTVLVGTALQVDLNYAPFGVAPGTYNGIVTVSTDDPHRGTEIVPVTYTVTGTVADATPGVCYATQGVGGVSDWVEINPTTGVGTVSGSTARQVTDLTIDPDGRIWTPYANSLYYIDAASGAMILRGLVGCWEEMAAYGDFLYAIDCNDQLWEMDPDNGLQTALAVMTPSMDGFAIDPTTGVFYMTEANAGPGTDNLYLMDVFGGGPLTLVGQFGLGLPIGDIDFDESGNLLGVVGGSTGPTSLVLVDKGTGTATTIGGTGIDHLSGFALIGSSPVDAPDVASQLPAAFALRGASPNPFHPMTQLSFTLSEAGHAELTVYDVAGRRVAKVVDQRMSAGSHKVAFHADHLASGMYFYELRANGHREIRKMTLLK